MNCFQTLRSRSLILISCMVGFAPVVFGQSVIVNPGFENGTSPWQFYSNGAASFTNDSPGATSLRSAHIAIRIAGSNVQMYQSNFPLEANTQYILTFNAYSNTGHDVAVSLQKHTSPYISFGLTDYVFDLSTVWNNYSVQFTTYGFSGTTSDARLRFWLAPYDATNDEYYFDDITLTKVGATGNPPVVTSSPSNQVVSAGQTATFSVGATGSSPLVYQWQNNSVAIAGATDASYTTPAVTAGDDGSTFRCIIGNSVGSATSNPATLTVTSSATAPTITSQPSNQTVSNGQTATFIVNAIGSAPLAYQWQKNNSNIGGATNISYTTPAASSSDNGSTFRCVVSNSIGSATSNSASLTVSPNAGGAIFFAVNSGANRFVSPVNGIVYGKDSLMSGGNTYAESPRPILATDDDELYLTERWGTFSYNIPLPNGAYEVELKFCETYWTQPGQRVFHVDIEGVRVLSNFDVLTIVPINTAYDRRFATTVADGVLKVQFISVTDNARLSGIVVRSASVSQPPTITSHPVNQTVAAGQAATFSVSASGSATLVYQWQKNYANIGGATGTSYTTPAAIAGDNGSGFRCIVGNSVGSATSKAATLTVTSSATAPTITSQPSNQTVSIGQTAIFTVIASGSAPLVLQWQKNNANIGGATDTSYIMSAVAFSDSGSAFRCVVTNSVGSVVSNAAILSVRPATVGAILFAVNSGANRFVSPVNGIVYGKDSLMSGGSSFTASSHPILATDDDELYLTERWGTFSYNIPMPNGAYEVELKFCETYWTQPGQRVFNVDIEGVRVLSNFDVLTIVPINTAYDRRFATTVADGVLKVQFISVTDNARLSGIVVRSASVSQPPTITSHPVNQTVAAGQAATFSVSASGSAPLAYQWRKNNAAIVGATSASYTTSPITLSDNGSIFQCIVSNSAGSATTNQATLTVTSLLNPPQITSHPLSQTILVGQLATFNVAASGSSPLTYQWQKNNSNIGGATNASNTTPPVTAGDNGSTFRCIVGNSVGSATSNAATLTVQTSPSPYPQWTHLSSTMGELPVPNGGTEQTASLVLDIDRDGVNDFVIAERTASPSVVWYRRSVGGWTKYIIDSTALKIEAGGAFYDIDGDGDLDIVFGGDYQSNQMWWWENPYPNYSPTTPWVRHIIKNSGASQHHDELFGNFKGDGTTQLVFWNQGAGTLYLATIPASPRNDTPWPLTPIFTYTNSIHEGLAKADIDGDGIDDIIGGGDWFKYNGNGTFTPNAIDNAMMFTRVAAGQLKAGGKPEVVFQAGDWDGPLTWYEWNGITWVAHQLLQTVVHGHSLQVADINADGKLDIFSAEMRLDGGNANAKMRIFYGDGQGNFTLNEVATGIGNHESRVADLNGDGRLDILSKSYNWNTPRIDVWMNKVTGVGLSLDLWTYIQADNSRGPSVFGNGTFGLGFGDLNGDGYQDIASGHYFYRNPGGNMTTAPWPRVTLPNNPQSGRSLDAFLLFDAEGTGVKNDIIAEDLPYVTWLRANDAQGNTWTPTVIAQVPVTSHGNGRTVKSAHIISANTKPDILLSGGDGIYLLQVPANPNSGNWPIMKITTSSNGEQKAIGTGDINRDGTIDIAVAKGADQLEVDWWSNPGNGTNTWVRRVIGNTNATAKMIEVADINADGRLDVIVTEEARPASVYWFEAPTDPTTGTWIRHTVATGLEELDSMSGIDMNNDGKPDIIVGEIFGSQRVIIYENVNNGASWNAHVVSSGKESHNGVRAVDLNNNGRLDIVSIAYNSYANLHVWRNDALALAPSNNNPSLSNEIASTLSTPLPTKFALHQNYPNPFNPTTTIRYDIPKDAHVRLTIFDMLGRELARLVDDQRTPGQYNIQWDAASLASGMYIARIETSEFAKSIKLVLVR